MYARMFKKFGKNKDDSRTVSSSYLNPQQETIPRGEFQPTLYGDEKFFIQDKIRFSTCCDIEIPIESS